MFSIKHMIVACIVCIDGCICFTKLYDYEIVVEYLLLHILSFRYARGTKCTFFCVLLLCIRWLNYVNVARNIYPRLRQYLVQQKTHSCLNTLSRLAKCLYSVAEKEGVDGEALAEGFDGPSDPSRKSKLKKQSMKVECSDI